jgi:hypothetical protein
MPSATVGYGAFGLHHQHDKVGIRLVIAATVERCRLTALVVRQAGHPIPMPRRKRRRARRAQYQSSTRTASAYAPLAGRSRPLLAAPHPRRFAVSTARRAAVSLAATAFRSLSIQCLLKPIAGSLPDATPFGASKIDWGDKEIEVVELVAPANLIV